MTTVTPYEDGLARLEDYLLLAFSRQLAQLKERKRAPALEATHASGDVGPLLAEAFLLMREDLDGQAPREAVEHTGLSAEDLLGSWERLSVRQLAAQLGISRSAAHRTRKRALAKEDA